MSLVSADLLTELCGGILKRNIVITTQIHTARIHEVLTPEGAARSQDQRSMVNL